MRFPCRRHDRSRQDFAAQTQWLERLSDTAYCYTRRAKNPSPSQSLFRVFAWSGGMAGAGRVLRRYQADTGNNRRWETAAHIPFSQAAAVRTPAALTDDESRKPQLSREMLQSNYRRSDIICSNGNALTRIKTWLVRLLMPADVFR